MVDAAASVPKAMDNRDLLEKTAMRKIFLRIIPYAVFAYFLCFVDRINIGFAALTMSRDLALTATMFGFGAGIFFIGYFLAEVPSNVLLHKLGARRWIARIMVSWGLISALMFLVRGEYSFYILRFLLGVAEAGFFPGLILYFTYWFPARYRGTVSSRFMAASPLSSMIGAPLSTLLLDLDGLSGMHGWQWLFLLEGIPTIVFGVVTLYCLTDKPADAAWLTPEEKAWVEGELEAEKAAMPAARHCGLKDALLSPTVLGLSFVYFCMQVPGYGFNMWIPQVVQAFGGLSTRQIGLVSAIPYVFAILGLFLWGWSSDRTMERKWHLLAAAFLAAGSLFLGAQAMDKPVMAVAFLSLCAVGLWSLMGVFWTVPPMFLTGMAAAGGIACINSIGNLGGFVGPFAMGWLKDATGSFSAGLTFLSATLVCAAVTAWIIISRIQRRAGAPARATR